MDEKTLRDLFAQCDVGWVFDGEGSEAASRRAKQILAEMNALGEMYAIKVGRPLPDLIERLILSDVIRFKPLVQSFASPLTDETRAMIFCLLEGGHVKAIRFEYERKRHAHLEIEVETESGESACFQSNELWDAEVLRHFGLAKLSGAPVIDGYYAFRKSGP
jgi:hypothetical protein